MNFEMVSIKGLDKADVLAALYNSSRPVGGLGFLEYDPAPMTRHQAWELLSKKSTLLFDLKGRELGFDLSGDEIDSKYYNSINGENAVQEVIEILKESHDNNDLKIQARHLIGTVSEADKVLVTIHWHGVIRERGVLLGYSNIAERLIPTLEKVVCPV
jgi:hypothetical protein